MKRRQLTEDEKTLYLERMDKAKNEKEFLEYDLGVIQRDLDYGLAIKFKRARLEQESNKKQIESRLDIIDKDTKMMTEWLNKGVPKKKEED